MSFLSLLFVLVSRIGDFCKSKEKRRKQREKEDEDFSLWFFFFVLFIFSQKKKKIKKWRQGRRRDSTGRERRGIGDDVDAIRKYHIITERERGSNHTEGIEAIEAHALSERVGDMNQSIFVFRRLRRGPPWGFGFFLLMGENVKCQF